MSSCLPPICQGPLFDGAATSITAFKTLFDALSVPANAQQVPNNPDVESDKRIFCLLEDDKLVTSVTVSNDRLLSLPDDSNDVLVVLRVRPLAFRASHANAAFAI